MEGFPAHRDACEWAKMRALFAEKDAYVFTTWSGGVPIDEFIKVCKMAGSTDERPLMFDYQISEIGFSKGVKIAVSWAAAYYTCISLMYLVTASRQWWYGRHRRLWTLCRKAGSRQAEGVSSDLTWSTIYEPH